ncbi:minor tail protein [Gordonia phage BrutonGaster]|uniref:Minor tail protein n=1 Tax=Gordonia phage BrutonGaster TaxID=2530116 RepID=A0A482JN46_9CAUD|nr:minor tail protein [Gordonia phage BrutonGaster]QBP33264.1 minor tail protein [Gordonia phage BrutonGaster]
MKLIGSDGKHVKVLTNPSEALDFAKHGSAQFIPVEGVRGPEGPAGPQGPPVSVSIASRSADAQPTTYPEGISIMEVGNDASWPVQFATVETVRFGVNRSFQTIVERTTAKSYRRTPQGSDNGWNAWVEWGAKGDKGDKGDTGSVGLTGATGPANTLSVGTVAKGSDAVVTITGSAPNQVLNVTLPKGDKGDKGDQGIQGVKGDPGDVSLAQMNSALALKANAYENGTLLVGGSYQGALYTHPENAAFVNIPHLYNDWAYLLNRGGSVTFTRNGVPVTPSNPQNLFTPDVGVCTLPVTSTSDVFVIEVTLDTSYPYTNIVSLVSPSWISAKDCKIEWFRSTDSTWVTALDATSRVNGLFQANCSASSEGTSKVRFTLTNLMTTSGPLRITQIANSAYNGKLASGPFIPRGGGTLYGPLSYSSDPVAANDLARKSYVDTQVQTRVPKATGTTRVYVRDGNGNENTIAYSVDPTGDAIVRRGGNSQIAVPLVPTADSHATPKKYVDDQVATRQVASEKGQANGYASLDAGGKVPITQLPSSIMEYQGTYNPATNTPNLVDGTGNTGDVYKIATDGTRNFGSGNIAFNAGDYVIYNGSKWEKSDTTDAVTSVAGKTGAVSLVKGDVGLGNVDNTSDLNKPISTATQTALDGKANASHTHTAADLPTIEKSKLSSAVQASLDKADTAKQESDIIFGPLPETGVAGKLYVVP